jgi:hypothetical protein
MSQTVKFTVEYEITFNTPDAPDVVAVPEELWKYYRIPSLDLYETVQGMHYMGEEKDLYVFSYDGTDGVVEAPTFHLGTWEDGTDDEQVYGPIEWTCKVVSKSVKAA